MKKIWKKIKTLKTNATANTIISMLALVIIAASEYSTQACTFFLFGQEDIPEDLIE